MTSRLVLALALACVFLDATAQAQTNSPVDGDASPPPTSSLPGLRAPEGGISGAPGPRLDVGDALPVFELPPVALAASPIDLTAEHEDLFVRLRSGFSIPDINNDLVLYHQQWYLNRPDYLRRMVERSRRYLHHVVEELEQRGMPTELALLPMVESAYNPMAYSRAKAAGLWQFIPSTGKNFKLKQDWWVDQRRDVIASTSAALDYLQAIYEMHGDWQLALASYNWGEGAVGRAIAKNRAKGLPTDYLSLTMPPETRHYVPKLQALKNIFGNPELIARLGLSPVPNQPYFTTVAWPANIDIEVAAKLAEMPVDDFVALNPAHNRPVIAADTPLVLPAEKVATFMHNLDQRQNSEKPLSFWQTYTLRPGEKLENLAPRFGMSLANLKEVNGIRGRLKLSPGFTVLVAAPDGAGTLETTALAEQPRLPEADPTPPAKARTYVVRKGDTLAGIARQNGLSLAALKKLNRKLGERPAPGTKLALGAPEPARPGVGNAARRVATASAAKPGVSRIAASERSRTTLPARASATPARADGKATKLAAQKKAPKLTRYTIQRGDTLASIARRFKVDADDVLRWNKVSAKSLQPGHTLTIELASSN
ncbi:lytic transglycosylase [Rhodocyclus tenuis]|uniref:Membrane-bound lytic murein transglycosylase D n=1 Tax=Rhodocyclus tenuis TaxID=1066 RepID=A0A840GA30_RHOTE|nr:LysM peptidoglycan-binding domain-containing protein [Rhodocyclus tenuis]MBB4247528.1 membrane-bound lytic murein transglycosylase D [Rhodocyclus tenuis]MBK1679608.1 lytic transglycosylase [Rhodocyclus tenuis]